MGAYYSILRFVNNPLSDESIALGLVVLVSNQINGITSNTQALFRISDVKVDFAKKLNPGCAKLLHFSITQIQRFFETELADQSNWAVQFPVSVKRDFLDRLAKYNNGLIQFTKPTYIETDNALALFERYFAKFIEANIHAAPKEKAVKSTPLRARIEADFITPLRGKIDVNYKVGKKQIPSLYFDYLLDGIGANGSMYAVKALDLNANHQISTLQKEVSEYESLVKRLDEFATQKKITGDPHYYLAVDPHQGNNREQQELYEFLRDSSSLPFKCIGSGDLSGVVAAMVRRKVHKFSDLLA